MNFEKEKSYLTSLVDRGDIFEAAKYIEKLIADFPREAEFKIVKCLFLIDDSVHDIDAALVVIDKALDNNLDIRFIILRVYIEYNFIGKVTAVSKMLLDSISKTANSKYNKHIPYLYSLYFETEEVIEQAEEYLKESVRLNPDGVYNYKKLASIYYNNKLFRNAEININKALKNILEVEELYLLTQFFDLDSLINEHFSGTHISHINYDILKEMVKKYSDRSNFL